MYGYEEDELDKEYEDQMIEEFYCEECEDFCLDFCEHGSFGSVSLSDEEEETEEDYLVTVGPF